MPTSPAQHQARIDTLMEQASQHLVHRRYFEAEDACVEALRKAHALREYDRMARILLPLQEARRHKRDQAIESGAVFLVDGEPPSGRSLVPGCYLIAPPRVGVDGRLLREAADKKRVPIVVIVREPVSRDGLWPIVAVGPVTLRTKVAPPPAPPPPPAPASRAASAAKGRGKKPARTATVEAAPAPAGAAAALLPRPRWFMEAAEALGDSGIASIAPGAHTAARVDMLMEMLEAQPDHEKLHQRLEEAARAAARDPKALRRPTPALMDDDEGSENGQDD